MYSTTVYVNSGKLNEQEYTYTGRRKGNEIIFTRMQDSLNEGDFTDLETPSVLTIKSPTSVEFENRTYCAEKAIKRHSTTVQSADIPHNKSKQKNRPCRAFTQPCSSGFADKNGHLPSI